MAIEQGLFQLITSDTAVKTAVGADANGTTRAFWILARQGSAVPFLVLSRVATSDTYAMAGSVNFRDGLFQVVTYASDYYTSRSISAVVRQLLENFTGALPDGTVVSSVMVQKDWDMPFEEGAKGFVYGAYLQFRVWYRDSAS